MHKTWIKHRENCFKKRHELYKNQGTTKFIPIIRKGDVLESFPIYLGQRKGLDMTDDTLFDKSFAVLIDDIRNV